MAGAGDSVYDRPGTLDECHSGRSKMVVFLLLTLKSAELQSRQHLNLLFTPSVVSRLNSQVTQTPRHPAESQR